MTILSLRNASHVTTASLLWLNFRNKIIEKCQKYKSLGNSDLLYFICINQLLTDILLVKYNKTLTIFPMAYILHGAHGGGEIVRQQSLCKKCSIETKIVLFYWDIWLIFIHVFSICSLCLLQEWYNCLYFLHPQ